MPKPAAWALLVPVLLIGALLGAAGLDADPIWQDEWFMIRDVRTSSDPLALAAHIAAANPYHAPGYFIVIGAWGRLFDFDPVPMRAFALFIGLLALAMTYRLGCDLFDPPTGWRAAAVLSASAFFVYYGHEVRMYTLNVFWTACVVWLYACGVVRGRRWQPALALVGAAMLYTHYFLALPLAAIGLYHLVFARRNRRWWATVVALAAAGLAFLPYAGVLLATAQRVAAEQISGVLSAGDIIVALLALFGNGQALLVAAALALTGLALADRRVRLVWSILVVTLALALAANALIGVLPERRLRYLILVWPLLALLVAVGIGQLRRPHAAAVALAGWLAFGWWSGATVLGADSVIGYRAYVPLHQITRALRGLAFPGDYLLYLLPPGDASARYAYNRGFYIRTEGLAADTGTLDSPGTADAGVRRAVDINTASAESADADAENAAASLDDVFGAMGTRRTSVWLIQPDGAQLALRAEVETRLAEPYGYCGRLPAVSGYTIDQYARSPVCCLPALTGEAPDIVFGDLLALYRVEAQPDGETLTWSVGLEPLAAFPPDTYSFAFHIVDAAGALVAQDDYGLALDRFTCAPRQVSLDGLTPGAYTLRVGVYRWQTGEPLSGVRAGAAAALFTVGSVRVAPR